MEDLMNQSDSTPDQFQNRSVEDAARKTRAFQISLLFGVVAALIGLGVLAILIFRPGTIGNPRSIIGVVFLAITSFVGAYLSRIGKHQAGIAQLVVSILVISFAFPFIASRMGLQIGLLTLMLIAGIASATLKGKPAVYAIVAAAAAALYNLLMDFFGPRLAAPGKPTVISIVTGVMVVVALFVILRQFGHYSLRSKLILSFILVTLVPLLILTAVSTIRLTRNLTIDAQRGLTSNAQQVALSLDGFLARSLDNAYVDAQLSEFQEYLSLPPELRSIDENREKVLSTLRLFQQRRSSLIRSYALLDINGMNVLDTDTEKIGRSEVEFDYFVYPKETYQFYVSPVLFLDDGPAIVFSSPIWGEGGNKLGILRYEYDAYVLQSELMSLANQFKEDELYAVVVDNEYFLRLAQSRNYGLVYRSYDSFDPDTIARLQSERRFPEGGLETLTTNQPDMVSWLKDWQSETFTSPGDYASGGDPALSTVAPLKNAPWLVITRQPVDAAMGAVDTQYKISIVLSIFLVLAMAGTAILVSQMIAQPIVNLTHVAARVGQGDLSARAPIQTEDEVGELAATFNQMTEELQSTLQGLELRVAERTRAIELSADVSRRLSTLLDPLELVSEVVTQLQKVFGYYHVQVYLFDEERDFLNMVGGTGAAGKTMVEQGHKLKLGQGLVGRACETGVVNVVADTHQDPQWLPNPLLPETKSEIAVPIVLGNEVLGALDVQDDSVGGIGQQDVDLLSSIASQVAIALHNSQQYSKTQRQAARASRINEIIQHIQNTQSIGSALQVAVRELGRELDAARITVKLSPAHHDRSSDN